MSGSAAKAVPDDLLTADAGRELAGSVKDEAIGAADEIKTSVADAGSAVKTAATSSNGADS